MNDTIIRKKTLVVKIGNVYVGGNHPVVVQSMTNTDTEDIDSTVKQISELYNAGSEIVRLTVNTIKAAEAIKPIRQRLWDQQINVPLVGDFHFNGHKILSTVSDCAKYLDKYRINPGNVGKGERHDSQFAQMIKIAIFYGKAIRIGVNWGSLDQDLLGLLMDQNAQLEQPLDAVQVMREALVSSAVQSAAQALTLGLPPEKIVLSCKVSQMQDLYLVYHELAKRCNYPLHLGLTEAGIGIKGIVASSIAIGALLQNGIGDTIRVSLTPKPDESRTTEVLIAQEILQTMGIRSFVPVVSSCPGCGRTSSTYFQQLADDIQNYLRAQMPLWSKQYLGVETMKVAVMGCVVNGPGESKLANIGISLPGRDENPVAPVYIDGAHSVTLKGDDITVQFKQLLNNYIQQKYQRITEA